MLPRFNRFHVLIFIFFVVVVYFLFNSIRILNENALDVSFIKPHPFERNLDLEEAIKAKRLNADTTYHKLITKDKEAISSKSQVPSPDPKLQKKADSHEEVFSLRRRHIIQMTRESWNVYKKYAFGAAEVNVNEKRPHRTSNLGTKNVATTIVDSVDTLYLMGMMPEYEEAKEWLIKNYKPESFEGISISLFEFNIRAVGGLLSSYFLTNDEIFLKILKPFAELILEHIGDQTFPHPYIKFSRNSRKQSSSAYLAEIGTFHLEFMYLSIVFKDDRYLQKANKIRNKIFTEFPNELPSDFLTSSGKALSQHYSLGAMGDSFYEYLIKSYVMTSHQDTQALEYFIKYIKLMENKILLKSNSGKDYFGVFHRRLNRDMEHLACFTGGMYSLAAQHITNADLKKHYETLASSITETCHDSYLASKTNLGPEIFQFQSGKELYPKYNAKHYILRPETVESYFYMWRATKDEKYRDWAWNATLALDKSCKHPNGGYSGIRNVNADSVEFDGVQQSFFLAETLKYLYLIQSPENVLPLDQYVFNTEAHPFPIIRQSKK